MFCNDFKFDGKKLSDFNMLVCGLGEDMGGLNVAPGAKLTFYTGKAPLSDKMKIYGAGYEEMPSCTFRIAYHGGSELLIPIPYPIRCNVENWLFRAGEFQLEPLDSDTGSAFFKGYISDWNYVLVNGQIYGYEITFTSCYPYGFFPEVTKTITSTASASSTTINPGDDAMRPIDTIVTVKFTGTSGLTIQNDQANVKFAVTKSKSGDTVEFNGHDRMIYAGSSTFNYNDYFNFNFLKLYKHYGSSGNNTLTCTGAATIEIKYNPTKKAVLI